MSVTEYLLDNRAAVAGARFAALSALFDDNTRRHVDALGIGPGARCWEVGAGGPTVPQLLAQRVGPGGHVLATDLDVSWIDQVPPVVEVRRHDIAADELPTSRFDLVHARLVLTHVPQRAVRCAGWPQPCGPAGGCSSRTSTSSCSPSPVPTRATRTRSGPIGSAAGSSTCSCAGEPTPLRAEPPDPTPGVGPGRRRGRRVLPAGPTGRRPPRGRQRRPGPRRTHRVTDTPPPRSSTPTWPPSRPGTSTSPHHRSSPRGDAEQRRREPRPTAERPVRSGRGCAAGTGGCGPRRVRRGPAAGAPTRARFRRR